VYRGFESLPLYYLLAITALHSILNVFISKLSNIMFVKNNLFIWTFLYIFNNLFK